MRGVLLQRMVWFGCWMVWFGGGVKRGVLLLQRMVERWLKRKLLNWLRRAGGQIFYWEELFEFPDERTQALVQRLCYLHTWAGPVSSVTEGTKWFPMSCRFQWAYINNKQAFSKNWRIFSSETVFVTSCTNVKVAAEDWSEDKAASLWQEGTIAGLAKEGG